MIVLLLCFRSTPVESLHTILLGASKYMVRSFMGSCSSKQKKEILARMAAFSYCGFSVRVTGNICYYYQSFVGRDFKAWMQMALFIIAPYLSEEGKKCWLLLSQVNTTIERNFIYQIIGMVGCRHWLTNKKSTFHNITTFHTTTAT